MQALRPCLFTPMFAPLFRVETAYGEDTRTRTACRQPDGTWEIVS